MTPSALHRAAFASSGPAGSGGEDDSPAAGDAARKLAGEGLGEP